MKNVAYIHHPVSAHAHALGVVYYSRTGDRSHQRYPHNDPHRFPIQHLPQVPAAPVIQPPARLTRIPIEWSPELRFPVKA